MTRLFKKKEKEKALFICADVRNYNELLFFIAIYKVITYDWRLFCFYKHDGKLKMPILKRNLP
jgi:hypothetical protein